MRRSRIDIRLGRFLTIDQHWRRRADDTVWRIRQVHRADCQVELDDGHGNHQLIAISELRADWKWIADDRQEAAA